MTVALRWADYLFFFSIGRKVNRKYLSDPPVFEVITLKQILCKIPEFKIESNSFVMC
jgi:hypothetical protein